MNLVAAVSDQNGGSEKKEEQTALMWAYERGGNHLVWETLGNSHRNTEAMQSFQKDGLNECLKLFLIIHLSMIAKCTKRSSSP